MVTGKTKESNHQSKLVRRAWWLRCYPSCCREVSLKTSASSPNQQLSLHWCSETPFTLGASFQEFNDFLARCLEKKPEDRPSSRALLGVSAPVCPCAPVMQGYGGAG